MARVSARYMTQKTILNIYKKNNDAKKYGVIDKNIIILALVISINRFD